jgi:hypothetical protein
VESEPAKVVGGFRPARRGATLLRFSQRPGNGHSPYPKPHVGLNSSTLNCSTRSKMLQKHGVGDFRPRHGSRAPKCACLDSARTLLLVTSCSQQVVRPAGEIRLRHRQSRAAPLGSTLAHLVGIHQLPRRDRTETLSIRPFTPVPGARPRREMDHTLGFCLEFFGLKNNSFNVHF